MSNMMMDEESMAAAMYAGEINIGLGSQFMAALVDSLLAGVIICQLMSWISNARHDTKVVRAIVGFGAGAAIFTTVYTWADYLIAFVYNYGKFARFASFELLGWYAVLDICTVIPVQLFFADRSIKINKNNKFVVFGDVALILLTMASAIGMTVTTRGHNMMNATQLSRVFMVLWPSVCTTAHTFITSTIIYGLLKTRTRVERSDRLIIRLVTISLESQLPATAFAVIAMITIAVNAKSPVVPFIVIVHPKVFLVGCLAMVNLRHTWRIKGDIPTSHQTSGFNGVSAPGSFSASSQGESSGPVTPKLGLIRDFSQRSDNKDKDFGSEGELQMAEF